MHMVLTYVKTPKQTSKLISGFTPVALLEATSYTQAMQNLQNWIDSTGSYRISYATMSCTFNEEGLSSSEKLLATGSRIFLKTGNGTQHVSIIAISYWDGTNPVTLNKGIIRIVKNDSVWSEWQSII